MEVAKIVKEICRRFLLLPPMDSNDKNFYQTRLKIISGLLSVIKNILNGNYLPIALFYSYNDTTYCDLLNTVFTVFNKYAEHSEVCYLLEYKKVYKFNNLEISKSCCFI